MTFTLYINQRTNDYQSDFLMTSKHLYSWKVHVLVITLLGLLCNCLLQARVLLRWWDTKCSATASLMTASTLHVVQSKREAFHIHTSEATDNLLDCLGLYCCEERGPKQFKVNLLPGVFYVDIYGIRMQSAELITRIL